MTNETAFYGFGEKLSQAISHYSNGRKQFVNVIADHPPESLMWKKVHQNSILGPFFKSFSERSPWLYVKFDSFHVNRLHKNYAVTI